MKPSPTTKLIICLEKLFNSETFLHTDLNHLQQLINNNPSPDYIETARQHLFALAGEAVQTGVDPAAVLHKLDQLTAICIKALGDSLYYDAVFFSPLKKNQENKNAKKRLIELFNSAKQSLYICMYSITCDKIFQSIKKRHEEGILIKIICDDQQTLDHRSDIEKLKSAGIAVKTDSPRGLMHHKFLILDQKIILTGSMNFSASATSINFENFLIAKDHKIAQSYLTEFNSLWFQLDNF